MLPPRGVVEFSCAPFRLMPTPEPRAGGLPELELVASEALEAVVDTAEAAFGLAGLRRKPLLVALLVDAFASMLCFAGTRSLGRNVDPGR